MGEPSSRDLGELPDALWEAAPVNDAQRNEALPEDVEDDKVEVEAPDPNDLESASLSKVGWETITNFTWFNIADRLKEIAPTKLRSGLYVVPCVVLATSLNNYASTKNREYQFRWHIHNKIPQIYMAHTSWSESEVSHWQTFPACRRQFACSLENSAWSDGWNDKLVLRISLTVTQGLIIRKKKWLPKQKDSRIHILSAMDEDSTYVVKVFRPYHDSVFGNEEISREQRFYDAGSLFDALVNIFENAGEEWKSENLVKWNDVREEVVGSS